MILRKYGKKEGGGNIIDVGSARKRVCTISIINGSRFHFWESKEREQAAKKIAIESVAVWTLTCAHLPRGKKTFCIFWSEIKQEKGKWWGPPFSGIVFVWAISFYLLGLPPPLRGWKTGNPRSVYHKIPHSPAHFYGASYPREFKQGGRGHCTAGIPAKTLSLLQNQLPS